MNNLVIYQQFFTNADCYKRAVVQNPNGIQVHSTGANNPRLKRYVQPDDGLLGYNSAKNSHNRPNITVCANAYIGKLNNGDVAIYQTLPWDYRCWLSGSGNNGNANRKGYIGFEVCEDGLNNEEYFSKAVMEQSTLLVAYLCNKFNISINNVRSHHELHLLGLASNHKDIDHWLKKFDLTMADYRNEIMKKMKEGVRVSYNNKKDLPVINLTEQNLLALQAQVKELLLFLNT